MNRTCRIRAATLGCAASILFLAAGRAAPQLAIPTVPAVDTQPVTVPVTLSAEGGENSLGWSVSFDAARLQYQQALLGDGATGATLFLNASQIASGRLGVLLSLPPGESFEAGEHTLLELRFVPRGGAASVPLLFGDAPVTRGTANVNGDPVTTTYANGAVEIATLLAPVITQEPANQAVYAGANAIFRVVATSDAPETYQWRRGTVNLAGERSPVLVLRSVADAEEGTYSVVVANGAGSVTSREATLTVSPGLRDDLIGQWDFDGGDLAASVGRDLVYRGNTAEVTTYQTQDVDGAPARTMGFPLASQAQGYRLFHEAGGNGGGARLNQYTFIADVMYPAASSGQWRALLQTDPNNGQDAEFYVGTRNGLWISGEGEHGNNTVTPDVWHRLAFVVNVNAGTVGKFVDGTLVHRHSISGTIDNAYSLGGESLLFTENNNETRAGFVNSIQIYSRVLSDAQVQELGTPVAEGLPKGELDQLRPTLLVQPAGQTVRSGEAVTLTAVARGTPPLTYSWTLGETPIPGAEGASLHLPAVTETEAGEYRVTVANALGSITSGPASVGLSEEDRVLQPGAVEILQGRTVTVPVTLTALGGEAAGSWSVQYDPELLRFVEASGAGGATTFANTSQVGEGRVGVLYSLPPGQALVAGNPTLVNLKFVAVGEAVAAPLEVVANPLPVELGDAAGNSRAVTTAAGQVDILSVPRITSQPESTAGAPGGSVAFSVEVIGTEPLTYRWRFNGVNLTDGERISGATTPTLLLENLQAGDAGVYSVAVDNRVGSAVSEGAQLVIGRLLRVDSVRGFSAERIEVPLLLFALGGENSVGASVWLDIDRVQFLEVVPGAQAPGASLLFNESQPGQVGIGVALPAGESFSQGWHEVARLAVQTAEPVEAVPLILENSPVAIEVTDALAEPLPTETMDGSLTTSVRPIDVEQLPDLVPFALTAPPSSEMGQPILIQWSVRNDGIQPAVAPWREALYVAPTPDGADRKLIAQITASEDLPSGAEIARSQTLVLPPAAAGVNYLIVEVDVQNSIAERVETNNRDATEDTITLLAPDLVAANMAAPDSALQGATINVGWDVRNEGSAPTTADWLDRLMLVPALGTLADGLELATLAPVIQPLPDGQQYRQSVSVTLPLSHSWPPGAYRLVALADFSNAQAELDEGNNQVSRAFELTTPPLPDLTVNSVTAPGTARPGVPFSLTWEVENRGNAPANAPWEETISFVHPSTGERSLALVNITQGLAAGAKVAREATVTLPDNSPTGDLHLAVRTDARDDLVEQNEHNNRRESPTATTVSKVLTLRVPLTQIREDAAPPTFLATVARSGDRSSALTVNISNNDPSEILAPATVDIPAGRSEVNFTLRVLGDGVVDGPQVVTLTASAPGHLDSQASLTVTDVDVPRLTLAFERPQIRENERVRLTVTREIVTASPLTVVFETPTPNQIVAPAPLTIPGNQASAMTEVIPVEDVLLEPTQAYEVRAMATGYQVGSASITIEDNDIPVVVVTIDRASINEGDGPQAANATVTRTPSGPQVMEVELESSDISELAVPARVVIPANKTTASVPVAAVEDEVVDGDQTVSVRAYPLASTSRVRLGQGTPAQVRVQDNDGPALSVVIERKLVAEGLTPATTATVTRNTPPDQALTVQLSSSDETEATVPPSVVIPQGLPSATFPINSVFDEEADGDQTVTVLATAVGFSSGEDTFVVSDRDLPDLVVGRVSAPEFVNTDTLFNVTYSVVNQGLTTAGTNWLTRVYLSTDAVVGDDQLLRQYSFTGNLPVNQQFEQTIAAQSPIKAGNYWIVVVTDVADQVREGLESNNARVSAVPMTVRPSYSVTVATDLEQALAGTPVEFYGMARNSLGNPTPSVLVNIHIKLRGTTRLISALTKADGSFRTTWNPLPTEAGFYEVGAAHPGVDATEPQDSFTLIGLRVDPAQRSFRVIEEASTSGSVRVMNLSPIPITGLAVEVVEKPANLVVETTLGSTTLPGVGEVPLDYTVSALDATIPGGLVKLRLTSNEGAGAEILFGVTVEALRPKLVARPSSLQAGVLLGKSRTLEFTVSNEGGRESGALNVALPDVPWMSLASINPIPSLQPGQTNVVSILLTPGGDLPLGLYTGNLAIASDTTFLSVPYNFRALSEGRGNALFTVVDEFTYYAEGAPNVEGATVTLRDPFSHATVAQGQTGADGTFQVNDLMEGYYNLEVSAPKHTTTRYSILIEPGNTLEETVFISRETVRYTWTVEPVEVEDHYKIVIETEFETVVPMPVITVEPTVIDLAKVTTDITQVNITITNHGLIAADAAKLHVPTHPDWLFEPLIEDIGILPARSSLSIPLTIRRLRGAVGLASPPEPRAPTRALSEGERQLLDRVSLKGGGPCHTTMTVTYELKCGPFSTTQSRTISVPNAGSGCGGGFPSGGGGGVWIGGGGGGGGCCGGGASGSYSGPSINVAIQCDPFCIAIALWGCIPGVNCVPAAAGCIYGFGSGGFSALTVFDCIVGVAGCVFPPAALPACLYALARCFIGPASSAVALAEVATALSGDPRPVGLMSSADAFKAFEPGVEANLGLVEMLFGTELRQWVSEANPDTGEWFLRVSGALAEDSDGGRSITAAELDEINAGVQPPGVPVDEVQRVIARLNRTVENWTAGIFNPQVALADGGSGDFVDFDQISGQLEIVQEENRKAQEAGYATPMTAMMEIVQELKEGEAGTCAKVKLRLEQEAVITRDAFQATLEIENDDSTTLENIKVDVKVYDQGGRDVSDLFGVRDPELVGLTDVSGTGRISAGGSGTAKWLIIPTVDAAPESPIEFFVAGEFSYVLEGTKVTVPLEPVSITVLPTPLLHLKYFHQRDVFSDDPFTPQIEPSIPFNLAVMIENRGYGLAKNFRITSAQPEIVENEKGLLIDFKIIATEVAGQNMVPSLTANFGNIDPGTSVVGRWLMTSTLQGLFTSYEASFEHVDGLGNPRLSLIQDLSIHEMVKLVEAGGDFDDGLPDFFVNQVPDALDFGDTLYLSTGETNEVELVELAMNDGAPTTADLEVEMSAALPGGWAYLRVPDPADGRFRLQRVERSDGTEIPVEVNVWVTDRTFVGLGKRPRRENILHLLDYDSTGQYTLIYENPPELDFEPPVSAVNALPADSRVLIPLTWGGTDNEGGSGIAAYDIYVSENGGAFRRWLWNTPDSAGSYLGQAGNSYAFYSRAMDAAGNLEDAPPSADAMTTVTILNNPPVLDPIDDQVIMEGDELVLYLSGADVDGDTLTFGLEGEPPPGMTVNGQNGELRWSTGEGLGGRIYDITVSLLDSGTPRLGVTRSFKVTVRDFNNAPILETPEDEIIPEGRSWTLQLVAEDFDVPAQQIRYALVEGTPSGMTIDPVTGLLAWRPSETQGGQPYEITVQATDNGVPAMTAEATFTILVRDTQADFEVRLGDDRVVPGEEGDIPVRLRSGEALVEVTFQVIERPWQPGLVADIQGTPLVAGASVTVAPSAETGWDVSISTPEEAGMQGDLNVANLSVRATDEPVSAWVPLRVRELRGLTYDGALIENGRGIGGNLFIVDGPPVLTPWLTPQDSPRPSIGVHGHAGRKYLLLAATTVDGKGGWTSLGLLSMSADYEEFEFDAPASGNRFLRLMETDAFDAGLRIKWDAGEVVLRWNSGVLESAPTVMGPWTEVSGARPPAHALSPAAAGAFYRVRQ